MSPVKQPWPDRFYGALLRVLPFEFRLEFGTDMEETFHLQRLETAREHGLPALLRMWSATIADIVSMAPREHASVLWQDVRYALRMMRQNRGYTAAAVLILGLGIGVNTSIFSAVNSVLIKPLPYLRGDDLVVLHQSQTKGSLDQLRFSVQEINDYRRQNRYLSGVTEYHSMPFTLLGGAEAHRVQAGVVSADFFNLFGVTPLLGRTFVADDDRPGAPPVLVLSYEYWKRAERSDPNIIGKAFQMNDRPHIVIGVLPPIPQYPNENDVYMPTVACPWRSNPDTIANRSVRGINLFGRLQPHVTFDECRNGLAVASQAMARINPASYPPEMGFQTTASLLRSDLTSRARPMLLALVAAAAFVLLIACANVANLTLARMARREHELVIRTAVGAGSGRLLRQLLTESLIMALLAAAVGLLFATGSIKLLAQFASELTPRAREITIDGWVLAFATLCASATTIVFGSVAALYSRNNVASGLKDGSRSNADRRRHIVRCVLISAQVAFSYVLLIGAGLMFHSFIRMNRVDLGFAPERVVAVSFGLNWSRYNSDEKLRDFSDRLLASVRTKPGVTLAALSDSFPLDPERLAIRQQMSHQWHFLVQGDPRPESESPPVRSIRYASPGYFRTLGIPVLDGRVFLESDTPDAPPVMVVNQSLAQRTWGSASPLGHRISLNSGKLWATDRRCSRRHEGVRLRPRDAPSNLRSERTISQPRHHSRPHRE